MLKIEFKDFQEKIKQDKLVNHIATIHCMYMPEKIIFVMKSREKWNYYSIVKFEDIIGYSQEQDMDQEEVIDLFITNYCSNTLPILPEDYEEIEILEDEEFNNEEITKNKILSGNQNNLEFVNSFTPLNKNQNPQITSGDDLVDDAKDYSDFLLKFFNKLEQKVLTATSKLVNETEKSYTEKTFGEFLRDLFNSVNTVAFAKQVKKYIKNDILKGLLSAETELNMDIGYTEKFKDRVNQLAAQQIDGYVINGKKWPGIKGVTKEIQSDVIKIVQSGIIEKQGLTKIKTNIKNKFDVFSDWRSEMIARTETNRIINQGKVLGYKESGLKGVKVWDAAIDSRTSPICERLNGQEVLLDDDFIDSETNKRYHTPPAHPNCRSVIRFVPK